MRVFCILAILTSSVLFGQSLWRESNLYSPKQNLVIGETLVVEINDVSRMRYTLNVENSKNSSVNAIPDTTITAYLPPVNSNRNITHQDGVKVESRGNIALRVAVTVNNLQDDGTYTIAGAKSYTFNGVSNQMNVTGRVHPRSIKGNSISADHVVNFALTINSVTRGLGLNLQRTLEEDEPASVELTEQQKQQIITDYLQKMVDELTK
ncbi:MAG: flagellar basal body L-ring protein FlgH [Spirochaetes bacterium]|jgi:flagellar basal body L-ring protein FlgH|nr:flagellar basal body L-ring protein FlgH [Spirochaetota bacterium]